MSYFYQDKRLGAFWGLSTDFVADKEEYYDIEGLISIFCNKSAQYFHLGIDTVLYCLRPEQLPTCTYS